MDFSERLDRAIERGSRLKQTADRKEQVREMSLEQAKELHGDARLQLTSHIEDILKSMCDRFPGFEYEGVYSNDGWGGAIYRDDIALQRTPGSRRGSSRDLYSRYQLHISPLGDVPLIELVAKATIRNRELFNRRHFERLPDADVDSFREMIDLWTLEYAEQFTAAG